MLISNKRILFSNSVPKHPNRAFLVPNLGILVFPQILQIDIFQGADLKYDNSIFNILPQKYRNMAYLVKNMEKGIFGPKYMHFLCLQIFHLGKFECVDFKYGDIVLKSLAKNTKIRHFCSQI